VMPLSSSALCTLVDADMGAVSACARVRGLEGDDEGALPLTLTG